MARPPRLQIPGAWYHVVARGMERGDIFKGDRDRKHFLELVEALSERFACNVSAFVLMQNHFHLFLQTLEPNLSRAVQWLLTSYSTWFNLRHNRAGHLFAGRFKAVVVDPANWAVSLTRYIHLNPVRVGRLGLDKASRQRSRQGLSEKPSTEVLRKRIATLRAYRWSSYPAYVGLAKAPGWLKADWILRHGGRGRAEQIRWYREYCEGAVREGVSDDLAGSIFQQVCLGAREFLQGLLEKDGQSELAMARRRPTSEEVKEAVAGVRDQAWEAFAWRHGDWGRDLALCLMNELSGQSFGDIAAAFEVSGRSAASMAARRFKARLTTDKVLRRYYEAASHLLAKACSDKGK